MNEILTIAAISGLLIQFLYVILAIALLGAVIWCINTYIHPIPPPILMVLAIIIVIVIAIWFLQRSGL